MMRFPACLVLAFVLVGCRTSTKNSNSGVKDTVAGKLKEVSVLEVNDSLDKRIIAVTNKRICFGQYLPTRFIVWSVPATTKCNSNGDETAVTGVELELLRDSDQKGITYFALPGDKSRTHVAHGVSDGEDEPITLGQICAGAYSSNCKIVINDNYNVSISLTDSTSQGVSSMTQSLFDEAMNKGESVELEGLIKTGSEVGPFFSGTFTSKDGAVKTAFLAPANDLGNCSKSRRLLKSGTSLDHAVLRKVPVKIEFVRARCEVDWQGNILDKYSIIAKSVIEL